MLFNTEQHKLYILDHKNPKEWERGL